MNQQKHKQKAQTSKQETSNKPAQYRQHKGNRLNKTSKKQATCKQQARTNQQNKIKKREKSMQNASNKQVKSKQNTGNANKMQANKQAKCHQKAIRKKTKKKH